MKKYELIKQYPGSDHVGVVVSQKTLNGMYEGWEYNYYKRHVENNPEYWEEVVEKDYEILEYSTNETLTSKQILTKDMEGWNKIIESTTFKVNSIKRLSDGEVFTVRDRVEGGIILGIHTDKFYTGGIAFSLDTAKVESLCSIEKVIEKDYEIISYVAKDNPNNITTKRRGAHLHEEYWKIHSVKRLSDGEVFTVGDRVKVYEHGSVKTITEIDINDTTSILTEGIWLRYDSGSSHIVHAIKQKSPIFLTHDGKDIFDGDTVWWVRIESYHYSCFEAYSGIKFNSDLNAYFLTREAAENYIEKSKVLFTTEDGVGITEGGKYYFVDTNLKISLAPNASAGCGLYDERKYFSTFETAQYYVIVNAKVLSIEEFWEFISKPGSNIVKQKALKRLVKERLNLK